MKLKKEILKIMGLLVCLVFASFPHSEAVVDWSDDFNDGNYDGWTVEEGDWDASTGVLIGYVPPWVTKIWCPSTQVEGTWSFDHYNVADPPPDKTFTYDVHFMANGSAASPGCNISGYGFRIKELSVYLIRWDSYKPVILRVNIVEGIRHNWNHYDITRNSTTGEMNVFVNGTHVLQATDTTYNYSEKFMIHLEARWTLNHYDAIDNIAVDDEIIPEVEHTTTTTTEPDTPTPTETPTEPNPIEPLTLDPMILAIGGGAICILAVVVVIIKRK